MRRLHVSEIRKTVAGLCIKANVQLRPDVFNALTRSYRTERNKRAKEILGILVENARLAGKKKLPLCQDTGMTVVFLEVGQDLHIAGGDLERAVNDGVRDGYRKGYLRKSVVDDPFLRKNTRTNTPCVFHTKIARGDRLKITVIPKGFGAENKSAIRLFDPTESVENILRFIVDVVKKAGPNACPPFVVGVGIGETFDGSAMLAKRSLARAISQRNRKSHIAKLERELLRRINALNIGPMGLGGKNTALGVNIETGATHIAGLPVAVNISCHATRGAEATL